MQAVADVHDTPDRSLPGSWMAARRVHAQGKIYLAIASRTAGTISVAQRASASAAGVSSVLR